MWLCSSEISIKIASEGIDIVGSPDPSSSLPTTFVFKLEDRKGRMHRFNCGTIYAFIIFQTVHINLCKTLPSYSVMLVVSISDTRSLTYLITSILQRVGDDIDRNLLPQILVS